MRKYELGSLLADYETGLKSLLSAVSNGNWDTLSFEVGSQYQVPAGKALYLSLFCAMSELLSGRFEIGYSAAAVTDAGAPPLAPVYVSTTLAIDDDDIQQEYVVFFAIPENMYPFIHSINQPIKFHAFGVEI